jgi:hypothetical protein
MAIFAYAPLCRELTTLIPTANGAQVHGWFVSPALSPALSSPILLAHTIGGFKIEIPGEVRGEVRIGVPDEVRARLGTQLSSRLPRWVPAGAGFPPQCLPISPSITSSKCFALDPSDSHNMLQHISVAYAI